MKVSNFRLLEVLGTSELTYKFVASVDITKKVGFLFKKSITDTRGIYRTYYGLWVFTETGELACSKVNALERAFKAKNRSELEHLKGENQ